MQITNKYTNILKHEQIYKYIHTYDDTLVILKSYDSKQIIAPQGLWVWEEDLMTLLDLFLNLLISHHQPR